MGRIVVWIKSTNQKNREIKKGTKGSNSNQEIVWIDKNAPSISPSPSVDPSPSVEPSVQPSASPEVSPESSDESQQTP